MNAHSRMLSLPGAALPMRERGASALDRVAVSWPAPDPSSRALGTWDAPSGHAIVRAGLAPWAAPDPVMRFDLAGPESLHVFAPIDALIRRTDLVEPRNSVCIPDLASASRAATAAPVVELRPMQPWPAPTIAAAAALETGTLGAAPFETVTSGPMRVASDRSGITPRLIVGLAAAAGALVAGAAALIFLF